MSDDDFEVGDAGVPDRITIRLDKETRQTIEAMMKASGLKLSQALRLLIALGAAREAKLAGAFKSAAWRDITRQIYGHVQKDLTQAMERVAAQAAKKEGDES